MLEVNNISVSYDGSYNVVDEVTFHVEKPALIGILGPNGAGKSTLIKGMLKLIPSKGELLLDGQPLKQIQRQIAYVEQKSAIDYTFPITVRECVSLGLYPKLKLIQKISAKQWDIVDKALEKVKMLDFKNRQIGELSGGQFQRVLIARTLVQSAKLIFLDEPFVGIDASSEKIIMDILRDFRNEGKTIMIVHHDLGKVTHYFDEIIMMDKKIIAYGSTKQTFVQENINRTYGNVLGGAIC